MKHKTIEIKAYVVSDDQEYELGQRLNSCKSSPSYSMSVTSGKLTSGELSEPVNPSHPSKAEVL